MEHPDHIIEPSSVILPPNSSVLKPTGPERLIHDLAAPKGFEAHSPSRLIVPRKSAERIVVPDAVAQNLSALDMPPPVDSEPSVRARTQSAPSQTEQVLLLHDARKYLASRARKEIGDATAPSAREVYEHLAELTPHDAHPFLASPTPFSPEVLQRVITAREYKDQLTGEKTSRVISYPGVLEQVVQIIVREASSEFVQQAQKTEDVVAMVGTILRAYRLNASTDARLPEMPDAAVEIMTLLNTLTKDRIQNAKKMRFMLYDALAEMQLPPSLRDQVFTLMNHHEDTEHPLAFSVFVSLVRENPDHPAVQAQRRRREELLTLLTCPAQEAFNNYAVFDSAAQRLVTTIDPASPASGKVGMEIEFVCQYPQRQIPNGWTVGMGGSNYFELRKDISALSYDLSYVEECVEAARWLKDCARYDAMTLHVHLDRTEHPHAPTIGGLLGGNDTNGVQMISRNDLGTWEVRANTVPMTPRGISVSSWLSLVELYTHATTTGAAERERETMPRLTLTGTESYRHLLWGHICANFKNPETRLATLGALRYPRAFRTINNIALLASFEDGSSMAISSILAREDMASYFFENIVFSETTITALLTHPNSDIAIATIHALGERLREYPEALTAITALLTHPDSYVVIATIEALGERLKKFVSRETLMNLQARSRQNKTIELAYHLVMINRSPISNAPNEV